MDIVQLKIDVNKLLRMIKSILCSVTGELIALSLVFVSEGRWKAGPGKTTLALIMMAPYPPEL